MQKQEFEERIERTVTDEQYKVIEEVYMWHPSIRNTSGKDEVAELYKSFGMTIFHDMLPRAKKAHELDELTNKEKQARAELKKRMQDKGVLPPDKPKLNRKKFIDEAREEWNGRSSDCFIWEHYLMDAISYMLCQREGMSSRASLEAVGAAKVLKLAIRLREFSEEVREKGEHEYKLVDQYNYIKDILDA